jgi:hypothetical protein
VSYSSSSGRGPIGPGEETRLIIGRFGVHIGDDAGGGDEGGRGDLGGLGGIVLVR